MDLGNHTFSHESPNDLGAQGYIDDIAKGEPVTRELLAARASWAGSAIPIWKPARLWPPNRRSPIGWASMAIASRR
jgi:peptidoglycan/xylan/chitin deacetylase (PgdA/CDA1 family)